MMWGKGLGGGAGGGEKRLKMISMCSDSITDDQRLQEQQIPGLRIQPAKYFTSLCSHLQLNL